MISNEGREFCRGIGLLAEHIICMADSFEEPIEKFRKSLFYSPEFEDKGKIIQETPRMMAEAPTLCATSMVSER